MIQKLKLFLWVIFVVINKNYFKSDFKPLLSEPVQLCPDIDVIPLIFFHPQSTHYSWL